MSIGPCHKIEKAVSLLESSPSNYLETEGISDPDVLEIAATTTLGTLDLGDMFQLLAEGDKTCSEHLRKALRFPANDPSGVKLEFYVEKDNGSIIAFTKIIPKGCDPDLSPDVFVGGIHHIAALYLEGAVAFAKEADRPLILVESKGVGANLLDAGASMDHERLTSGISNAIEKVSGGRVHYLMGHSLGSIVVRHLYHRYLKDGNRLAERYVPVAMLPARGEERSGLKMDPFFSIMSLPSVLAGDMTAVSGAFFFNAHPEEERAWLEKEVYRESVRVGLFGFMDVMNNVSDGPLTDHVGEAPLAIVFAGNDRLMQLKNADDWDKKGVVFLKGGDHSCLAGKSYAVPFWLDMLRGLNEEEPSKEAFDAGSASRTAELKLHGYGRGSTGLAWSAGLRGGVTFGLGTSFDASFMLETGVGYHQDWMFPMMGALELEIYPFDTSRFSVPLGIKDGIDLQNGSETGLSAYLGFRYDLFNIIKLGSDLLYGVGSKEISMEFLLETSF